MCMDMEPGRELLLVDDDQLVLPMLKELFEGRGFKVSTATSAKEAIAALDQAHFDILVTDMRMETPTAGFDVIASVKAQQHRPVAVILSAFPIPATDWRAAGADALFMKVADTARMLGDLEQLLRRREQRYQAQAATHKRKR